MDKINQELADLGEELIEEKINDEYSYFIQSKLYEFYIQDFASRSYDNDAAFYGEMI